MNAVWFVVKKVLSRLLFPLGQALLLWLAGALVWWRRPSRRLGPLLMLAAGLWLLVLSLPLTGSWLVQRLELRNYQYATPSDLAAKGVHTVVVLSGGFSPGPLTKGDRLSQASLKRLLEGVRLWKQLPGAQLVLSGGSFFGDSGEGAAMAGLAQRWGVPGEAIRQDYGSWDTEDQARRLRGLLQGRPFALVTSAIHMPRALMLFRIYGLHPVPAPADFRAKTIRLDYGSLIPQAGGLLGSQMAMHEYLGLAWLRLKLALGWSPLEAAK